MATTCIFHMYMSRSFSDTLSRLRANMSLLLHFSDVYLAWKPLNNVVPFFFTELTNCRTRCDHGKHYTNPLVLLIESYVTYFNLIRTEYVV